MGDMFREKEGEDLILKGQRVNVKLFCLFVEKVWRSSRMNVKLKMNSVEQSSKIN
jgi:hypothetical protein